MPVIGITIGDPAGIGPEIVIKSVASAEIRSICRPVIIGDRIHLEHLAEQMGTGVKFTAFGEEPMDERVEVFDLSNLEHDEIKFGEESPMAGRAAGQYIEAAVELWKQGKIDAIATAPISKRSLGMGGYDFPGHTEFLAKLTGTEQFAMSFFAEKLRVVLISTHVSLRDAIELVTPERLLELIAFTNKTLSNLLGRPVKIAVAGLNPHASENGMFGTEEKERIEPAIAEAVRLGIDAHGPFSPDTIFLRGFRGEFDAVIACYHDQATIAVKSLSFGSAVNVTLGLPLVRTSVDHGTAFDIAGKGVADHSSMSAAILLAATLLKE